MNIIELTAKATAVFAAAGFIAFLFRRRSAAVRHLVWAAAVLAAVLLPFGSAVLPAVPVAALQPVATVITVYGRGPAAAGGAEGIDWAHWLTVAWLAGVGLFLLRLLFGIFRIVVITVTARPTPLGSAVVRSIRLRRAVRVRISDALTIPTTWGVLRPTVLLPRDAHEWTGERLAVVLAHELCHVRRLDWLTQLIAHIACALYWFHPLSWFAARELRRERELACDDGVLTAGVPGTEYAQHLVEIARTIAYEDGFTVGVAMAQKSNLETRVLAMLDPSLKRGRVTRGLFAMATLAVAVCILPLSALRAPAQGAGGKVSGSVFDPSGAAVAKAQVTLKNTTGRNTELTRTNESGTYEISGVPPGTYTLQVAAKGFARFSQPGIVVTPGSAAVQNASLQIGQIAETLDITAQGAKPVQTPSGSPQRLKMGGKVQATKLVHMVRPEYPAAAKAQGIEGSVLLRAVIGREGQILNLELLSTAVDPLLSDAAMEAVRQWRYEPTLLNGEPVEIITEITVNFVLQP